MKTASAKAKGRRLQDWFRNKLTECFSHLGLERDDFKPAVMGETGEDIKLSPAARKVFPYYVECKNRQTFTTLYKFYAQAHDPTEKREPLLVIKMNNKKPLVVMDAEHFLRLLGEKK